MLETGSDQVFNVINSMILALVLIVTAYPLFFILIASVSDIYAVGRGEVLLWPKGFQLVGYIRVFKNNSVMTGYRNTLFYTIFGTCINLFLTMTAGYAISIKFKGRKFIMFFLTFTMFFSGGMIPTYFLIKNLKLLDSFWVMILPNAVSVYNLIIARTFLSANIPNELYEAAEMDGCSRIKFFCVVVLPLSTVLISVLTLFYAVGHWNAYFNAMLYLSNRDLYPLQLIVREILILSQLSVDDLLDPVELQVAQQMAELIKYTLIIVVSLPVLIMYPFIQRYFVKGIMIGSIKG